MTWKLCLQAGGKALSAAALALGILATAEHVSAADYYNNQPNCCPPGYRPGYGAPGYGAPGQRMPGRAPSAQGAETSPSDLPADQDPNAAAQPQQQQQQQPDFSAPSDVSSSQASLSNGASTPMLGRVDVQNRLNLFDNMSAAVRDRVWVGFQYSDSTNAQVIENPAFTSAASSFLSYDQYNTYVANLGVNPNFSFANQTLYRVGVEKALFDDFSVAFQGQYISTQGDASQNDQWTNPQIMFKYMLCYDNDSVLSATLGFVPQSGADRGDVDEDTSKIYPGMLFYETLSSDLFAQGGFQFGIPVRGNNTTSFDWSLALGYWLYRDCCPCGQGGFLTGIVPQVNLLGKHVVGDNTIVNPYGLSTIPDPLYPDALPIYDASGVVIGSVPTSTASNLILYREGTDILDLTAGATFLFANGVQLGVGYSFPITDSEARKSEFLASLNYVF